MDDALVAADQSPQETPRAVALKRTPSDRLFRAASLGAGMTTLVVLVLIGTLLLVKAMPALKAPGPSSWHVLGHTMRRRVVGEPRRDGPSISSRRRFPEAGSGPGGVGANKAGLD